jgi:hypothetical protein
MPTFDENVNVNGTVAIKSRGKGAVILDLRSERNWQFRQFGTGASTSLELASLGGGGNKHLLISTTGKVGIGTTSPAQKLQVEGGVRIVRPGKGAVLLELASERGWAIRQLGTGASTALELASVGGGGNKDFIITTKGKVGIGTTSPQETLDVNGSIRVEDDVILAGADCAEEFDIDPGTPHDPGTVMVIGPDRRLRSCSQPYDTRVAGVISGAGDLRPGIVLGRRRSRSRSRAGQPRLPLALSGTVFCQADATAAPIRVGDLLTTSSMVGHAMRAGDAVQSFGAVIGKALDGLATGTGLIPVLVTLH